MEISSKRPIFNVVVFHFLLSLLLVLNVIGDVDFFDSIYIFVVILERANKQYTSRSNNGKYINRFDYIYSVIYFDLHVWKMVEKFHRPSSVSYIHICINTIDLSFDSNLLLYFLAIADRWTIHLPFTMAISFVGDWIESVVVVHIFNPFLISLQYFRFSWWWSCVSCEASERARCECEQ